MREIVSSAPKSTLTCAIEPSGSGTPPCDVPVWIEILLIPMAPARRPSRLARNTAMKASNSSGVEFLPPTSPISPPTEIVTPSGSCARMKAVSSAHTSPFFCCCASCPGWERSTRVELSTSMLKKPAWMPSTVNVLTASTSAAGSAAYFFAFIWKWSPWRNSGPRQPSRRAAAMTTNVYSAGRWSV